MELFANMNCHNFGSDKHCPYNTKSVCLFLQTRTAHQFVDPPTRIMFDNWGEDSVYEPGKIVPYVVCVIIPGSVENSSR